MSLRYTKWNNVRNNEGYPGCISISPPTMEGLYVL